MPTETLLAGKIEAAIKDYINSDDAQKALGLMDETDRSFLVSFASGMRTIEDELSARNLLQALELLNVSYERVEITSDELERCINRPMKIGDVIASIEVLLNKKSVGKDREKVRIVLSK